MTPLDLEFLLNDHGLTFTPTTKDKSGGVVSMIAHPEVKTLVIFGGYRNISRIELDPYVRVIKRRLAKQLSPP